MIIHANCKINLGLNVTHRRDDGFHELCTVMLPVKELYDIVTVDLTSTNEIEFHSEGLKIDCKAENNLCIKAAKLTLERYNKTDQGVSITLDKRVPFGAGLGGGSSDATAVIMALNKLLELNLTEQQLIDLAAELGSDTAFFVRNTPQYCTGRGEIMQPMPKEFCELIDTLRIEITKPEKINISTREAFSGIKPHQPETPLLKLLEEPIETWQESIKNDFEPHIFAAHPTLQEIKNNYQKQGAIYTAMSGSGSTIFALFDGNCQI
ncbi:MAG: 4-(cytidine 5'-diphospho)-2-C-methyl-D-erythritol kinase [Rikenellaceae bacterium]